MMDLGQQMVSLQFWIVLIILGCYSSAYILGREVLYKTLGSVLLKFENAITMKHLFECNEFCVISLWKSHASGLRGLTYKMYAATIHQVTMTTTHHIWDGLNSTDSRESDYANEFMKIL